MKPKVMTFHADIPERLGKYKDSLPSERGLGTISFRNMVMLRKRLLLERHRSDEFRWRFLMSSFENLVAANSPKKRLMDLPDGHQGRSAHPYRIALSFRRTTLRGTAG